MTDDFNDPKPNSTERNPILMAVLVVGLLIILAGVAYVYLGNRSASLTPPGDEGIVEEVVDDANPFPAAERMNLPPTDELVKEPADTEDFTTDQATPVPETTQDAAPATVTKLDVNAAMSPRSLGEASAPVRIQEFFSLTCGHCAHFHNETLPALKKYIDSGEVYMEFHEFPLNAPALRASMIARCLPADRYYGFITLLFKTQDVWASTPDYMTPLRQNAKLAGMSDEQFDACMENNELQQALGERIKNATDKWKIDSTPTFVINDGKEKISGAQPIYEFERVFRSVTNGDVAPLTEEEQKASEPAEPITE